MRFVSWNVNGLRACLIKGFMESFRDMDADIFCVQETKMQPGQAILELPGYTQYWNSAEKKGYSGTAVFSRVEPLSVSYGLGIEEHDHEGRVITLELPEYYLVTVYTPNSQKELARIGIPAHKLGTITNPFEQAANQYTRGHEGSGLGSCVKDVKEAYPKANVEQGISIYGHDVRTGKERVEKWLKKLGYQGK